MSIYRDTHKERIRPFADVPGPEPTFPFGNAPDFAGHFPWEVCANYGQRFGRVSVFYLMSEPILLLHDAALIQQVLETDRDSYYKDNPVGALMPVLSSSSPNIANGADWANKRARNPLTRESARAWLAAQAAPLTRLFAARFAALATRTAAQSVPFLDEVQRLVFDAFSHMTVGCELGDDAYADFLAVATAGSHRMLDPNLFHRPLEPELDLRTQLARERWHLCFAEALIAARKSPQPGSTLVALMAHGCELSDGEIVTELSNVFFGGDFSVPSTLVTAAWCLTHSPAEAEKLRTALQALPAVLGAREIEGCTALDYALREAMRYRAAVPLFDRRVRKDRSAQLGNLTLPPDTHIFISNWLLHQDAGRWAEPEKYQPDRWANGVAEANPLGSGYFFPFGRGPRMCMGMAVAMFTMKAFLAELYRSYRVEAGAGQAYDEGQEYFFGVRMPRGLKARIAA